MELNLNLGSLGLGAKKNEVDLEKEHDLVVIGGGPAGINSALYGARKGLRVVIVTDRLGGQVLDTTSVENYLGFDSISGEGLIENFKKHMETLEIPVINNTKVTEIVENNKYKSVVLDDGRVIISKTVIIATGSKPRNLGVPGEEEYRNRGVAYCAICDGPLFQGLKVVVAGGGNSAVEAAIDLSKICEKVTIVHRSEFRADKIVLDKLNEIGNIDVMLKTKIKEIQGEKLMNRIIVEVGDELKNLEVDGLFVEIGYLPNSDFVKNILETTEKGEIKIDSLNKTSVGGIFAAGDVTNTPYKQIVVSAGEGAKAALSANDYINKNFN